MSYRIATACFITATAFALTGDERYEQRVAEVAQSISHWESIAVWQLATTILIAALGAAVSALQGISKPWSKQLTVVLGASVTVVTVGANTYFPADYRAIRKAAVAMRQTQLTLRDLNDDIRNAHDPGSRNAAIDQFLKLFDQIKGIENKLLNTASLDVIPVVHAQSESGPAWIQAPPANSKDTLYFVGSATGPTYVQAREAAIIQAARLGASRVNPSKELAPGIAEYLRRNATVADTFYVRDGKSREYVFHVLLRASADVVLVDTSQFAPSVRTLRLNKLLVREDGGHGPTPWAFEIFVEGTKAAAIPSQNYDNKNQPQPLIDWPAIPVRVDKAAKIEIRGYRPDNPSVKASGSVIIAPNGEVKIVPVRNSIPLRGSFDFLVAVNP